MTTSIAHRDAAGAVSGRLVAEMFPPLPDATTRRLVEGMFDGHRGPHEAHHASTAELTAPEAVGPAEVRARACLASPSAEPAPPPLLALAPRLRRLNLMDAPAAPPLSGPVWELPARRTSRLVTSA